MSKSSTSVSGIATPAQRTWFHRLGLLFSRWSFGNSWEIYLLLLVAAFLRFYQIDTTEFDDDQAILFRMAHDAIAHGLLPITSNTASISIAHPPGVIYLFMLPVALSADPLWSVVFVGVFNVVAVLLTYLFTRRYYGRLAGSVAALLYAVALIPVQYSRFIWQPNLMPPFVVLFMFTLFWGAVDRRKGWLFPALVLFGILYQMHETSLLLLVPLFIAVMLAPGTMRWRDLVFAFVVLLIIFSPYLLWEVSIKFADVLRLFSLERHGGAYPQRIGFYLIFLSSYGNPPANVHSLVRMLAPAVSWLGIIVPFLALGGFVVAGVCVWLSDRRAAGLLGGTRRGQEGFSEETSQRDRDNPDQVEGSGQTDVSRVGASPAPTIRRGWWVSIREERYRCGLFLLLVWQVVPLAVLLLHSIGLTWHYFLILMPGPFIFVGLFVSRLIGWLRGRGGRWSILHYGVYVLVCLIAIAQVANCAAAIVDTSSGNFNDRGFPPYPYHNDLRSLQQALGEADQLAQRRHLNRVYVTTDRATQTALRYLAEEMQTPTTLFDATRCLVLPNPANGPAVLLVGPYDDLTNVLLSQFASATLVDQPARLGGPPFRLFIVTPKVSAPDAQEEFAQNLRLMDGRARYLNFNNSSWLVTRWSFLQSAQPRFRTTYSYALTALVNGDSGPGEQSVCTFTSMGEGDELLVVFNLPAGALLPASVIITGQSFMTIPDNPVLGPVRAETNNSLSTAPVALRKAGGGGGINLSIAGV